LFGSELVVVGRKLNCRVDLVGRGRVPHGGTTNCPHHPNRALSNCAYTGILHNLGSSFMSRKRREGGSILWPDSDFFL
jgi:hypothetical protein